MMGRLVVRDTQPQQVTSVKGPGSCASISSTTPSSIPVGKKSPRFLGGWMEEEPRGGEEPQSPVSAAGAAPITTSPARCPSPFRPLFAAACLWANALPPRNAMAGSQRQRAQTRQAATDESSRRMSIRATFASSSHAARFKVEIGAWIHACRARGTGVGARDLHCDSLRAVRGAAQQEEPRVLTVLTVPFQPH
ncbi:hypothetical protein CCHR01_08120 [Colletotrichum chrysophilum]|uniref:Uncharacterized protein n=1 Tax=Colletotrichum chrysophilum TaxID=1836956 RepID=A0AAD9EI70_9PEZI|nr:hypothetical protein CCHR01_08120 [Colletotrichum chrysophilum]